MVLLLVVGIIYRNILLVVGGMTATTVRSGQNGSDHQEMNDSSATTLPPRVRGEIFASPMRVQRLGRWKSSSLAIIVLIGKA